MSALPPELADPLEELRAKLVEINDSEQTCMTNVVASAPQGKSFPEVQAVMARCRQASAAAATTAINAFRHKCSEITTQTNSLTTAAIISAAKSICNFWAKSESSAAAFASEIAARLPAQGPDKTTQAINNICGNRASSINRYFEQLTT
jgi:predicted nucleic acid-binding protein